MAKKRTAKKKAAKKKTSKKKSVKKKAAKKKTTKRKTAKKATKKKAKKKATKKKAKKTTKKKAKKKAKKKTKRKPNAQFMKPMKLSSDLAAVVGSKPIPRTQVTKKLWAYIKKNKLQDNKNRRMINADQRLGKIFGRKKQVSMFEMTALVNKHLS